jgi:hypothetical protein
MRRSVLHLFALVPTVALAQQGERIPEDLFGVPLGAVYRMDEDGSHDLPVKKVTGVQRFIGMGVHVYFEPLEDNPAFLYSEQREDGNEYFKTSHRLYMLPVLADDAAKDEVVGYRVALVEWSEFESEPDQSSYFWASSFCKSVAGDLGVQAEIVDFYEESWYGCDFAGKERQLVVTSQFGKTITLSFNDEISEQMEKAIEVRVRQLEMDRVRPYTLPNR